MKTIFPKNAKANQRQLRFSNWRYLLLLCLVLIFCIPIITVVLKSWGVPVDIAEHLKRYVLPRVLPNTLIIVFSVTVLATGLGVLSAWLVVMYEFPGRKFFSWALLLPIAIPGYVMAFVLLGLFDFSGPVQSLLREWFGSSQWFPQIRSIGGAILALSLCLYPYVYLLVRGAFEQQGQRAMEVAQSLGHSPLRSIFSLAIPMARPWIIAGSILVMMETLADFGTVAVFNVDTFTTAIYQAWYGMDSLAAALRLAAWLMFFVVIVLWLETRNKTKSYQGLGSNHANVQRYKVGVLHKISLFTFCACLFLLSFVFPITQLLFWFFDNNELFFQTRYINFFVNSLLLALLGACLLVILSVIVISMLRNLQKKHREQKANIRLIGHGMTIGYAIPGTVLAVGLIVPLASLSNFLLNSINWQTQLLTGSVLILLLGYTVRFFAVAYRPIESQLERVSDNLEEMSEIFQVTGWQKWKQVLLPLLRPGLLTAFALCFVDIMKEMPLTLMTRPFGWDTLAIQIFELTSEGEWEKAAVPAVSIVLAGIIPVYLLNKQRDKI